MNAPNQTHQSTTLVTLLSVELALVCFLVPAGRFYIDLGFYQFTTGYDAYKLFPVVFITWLVWRWREHRGGVSHSRLFDPMALWFLCSFFAAVATWNPYQALTESLELFCYLVFFIFLIDLPWRHMRLDWIASAFVIGNLYLCGIALRQLATAQSGGGLVRLNAVFDHPNQLGGYAILGAPLLGWLALQAKPSWQKTMISLTALGVICAGALTLSRSVYVALACAGAVALLIGSRTQRTIGVTLACVMAAAGLIAVPSISQRFIDLFDPAQIQSESSRLLIWSALFDSAAVGLPHFGVGYGPILQEQLNNWIASAPPSDLPLSQWGPHSAYLATLLSTGLPGLCAYLWLLIEAFRLAWRCPAPERVFLVAALSGAVVHQAFIFPILTGNYPIALFVLFAISQMRSQQEDTACERI